MSEIPYGYCHCGCGGKTNLSPDTNKKRDYIKGNPFNFIKGHTGRGKNNPNWNGGVTVRHGYKMIFKPEHPKAMNKRYVLEHVYLAEKALGKPLPIGAEVHHHTPTQLVICQDHAYHFLIEKRTRAYRACGHASWLKCPICKRWDTPEKLYTYYPCKRHTSLSGYHRSCKSTRDANRRKTAGAVVVED